MTELENYVAGLRISQGEGAGGPFVLLPWQKRLLRGAFAPSVQTGAVSVGRGNGKTTLFAATAAAAVDGPLVRPRGETVVVASSFGQSRILFEHARAFLAPVLIRDGVGPRGRFRIQDSANSASIEDRGSGARLRCIGSDPKRAHGLAPSLVLCDEPSQWEAAKTDAMIAALRTSLGKIPGSRLIALGTRPADRSHWFEAMLLGGADFAKVYAAAAADPIFQLATWKKANPSLASMPALLATIRREAAEAKRDASMLASFKALRLNLGTAETIEAMLLDAGTWEQAEQDDVAKTNGYSLGIDLGTSAAMSAAAAYWPESGALDCFAVFPEVPSLAERGMADGVGRLYQRMQERGELIQAGRRVSDIGALLNEARERWGVPKIIGCDRWRESELRQCLEASSFPLTGLEVRGMGWNHGAADVRAFRSACLSGKVSPVKSLLLRSAMAEARTVSDVAGNWKLAKKNSGGRRATARDDAAAAAILAVAIGSRAYEGRDKRSGGRVVVA